MGSGNRVYIIKYALLPEFFLYQARYEPNAI